MKERKAFYLVIIEKILVKNIANFKITKYKVKLQKLS